MLKQFILKIDLKVAIKKNYKTQTNYFEKHKKINPITPKVHLKY